MVPPDQTANFSVLGRRYRMSWSTLILTMGFGLIFLLIVETLVIWAIHPELVFPILRGVATEIMTGREAGVPVFLEGGVPTLLTIQYSFMQDLATSFIVYPLFILLLNHHYHRDNMVMRFVRRTQTKAARHEARVQTHGPIFLFLFMLIPFMVNGALIGLLIGRLVRMRMASLITVVVAATLVPAIGWTLFYNTLFGWAQQIVPNAPAHITLGVVIFVALLIVTGAIYETVKENKHKKTLKNAEGQSTE